MIFDNIIIAPESAPQVLRPAPAPPKPPRLDWIDQLLLDRLTDAGSCPTWTLLNAAEAEHPAQDRTRGRLFRLQLWGRLKRLRRLGMVFAQGRNRVSATKPDPARRPAVRRRRPTVVRSTSFSAVSARTASESKDTGQRANQAHAQLVAGSHNSQPTPPTVAKTESAPAPELVSAAASALARQPRRPKRIWSGWLNDRVRVYRNMPVLLPGGEQAFVFGANRGMLVYVCEPGICAGDPDEAGQSWGVLPASRVRTLKNHHAVTLGKRKAGVREKFSPSKVAAARRNGGLPARTGRRRGRPRSGHKSIIVDGDWTNAKSLKIKSVM